MWRWLFHATTWLTQFEASTPDALANSNGFAEEGVEERIQHAIKEPGQAEAVVQHPIESAGDGIVKLVKHKNPIWKPAHDEH